MTLLDGNDGNDRSFPAIVEAFLDTDAELKVWAKKFDLPRNN